MNHQTLVPYLKSRNLGRRILTGITQAVVHEFMRNFCRSLLVSSGNFLQRLSLLKVVSTGAIINICKCGQAPIHVG